MDDWLEIFRRFAALRPTEWIDRKVLHYLQTLPPGKPLLIACSGGADSVFLALSLFSVFEGDCRRLILVHYNHGLRGEEADADEAFVEAMGAGLGVAVFSGHPEAPLGHSEASLRKARYDYFSEVYLQTEAVGVALGHHADDLLESLLMGLFTGSGPAGLASPMPVKRFSNGQVRLRPLLPVKQEKILSTLKALGIPWREDPSNQSSDYTRNWLRHELIPKLHKRFPQDIYTGALRTRELMEETVYAIDIQLKAAALDSSNPNIFDVGKLAGDEPGLVRRAFMSWWLRHYPDSLLPKAAVDTVVQRVCHEEVNQPVAVGKVLPSSKATQMLVLREDGCLTLLPEGRPEPDKWKASCHWCWEAGPLYLPDGAKLMASVQRWEPSNEAPYLTADPTTEAWLEGVGTPLQVRQWQAGDRYRPLGAPGRRKLQDLFVDAKLKPEQKWQLPVITGIDGSIVWVPGFPPCNNFKVCQTEKSALKLTYVRH